LVDEGGLIVEVVDDQAYVLAIAVVVLDEAGDVFLGPAGDVDSGLNAKSHRGVLSLTGRQPGELVVHRRRR
jgi:hypothetical protein